MKATSNLWKTSPLPRVCYACKVPLLPVTATSEHLIPKIAGGPNTLENQVLACDPCNYMRGILPVGDFLASRWLDRRKQAVAAGVIRKAPKIASQGSTDAERRRLRREGILGNV